MDAGKWLRGGCSSGCSLTDDAWYFAPRRLGSAGSELGGAESEVVASVDGSSDRTARGVEDIIADVSQLIFAEGLLQRIRQLLTLARRSGQNHIKRDPQLLLRLWVTTNLAPLCCSDDITCCSEHGSAARTGDI